MKLFLLLLASFVVAQNPTWCFYIAPNYLFPFGSSSYEISWSVDATISKYLDRTGQNQALPLHKFDVRTIRGLVRDKPSGTNVASIHGTYIMGQRLVNAMVNQIAAPNNWVALTFHFNPYTNQYFQEKIYDTFINWCQPPNPPNTTLQFIPTTCGSNAMPNWVGRAIPDPIIWYKFNHVPDPQVLDSITTYPHHGYMAGNIQGVRYAGIAVGTVGGATNVKDILQFQSTGWVVMPALLPYQSYTFTFWVFPRDNNPSTLFACGNGDSTFLQYKGNNADAILGAGLDPTGLRVGAGTSWNAGSLAGGAPFYFQNTAANARPAVNTWTFVAVVMDFANNKNEVVDARVYTSTAAATPVSLLFSQTGYPNPNVIRAKCTLGADLNGGTRFFGDMADFRFFATSLSVPQIEAVKSGW